MIIRDSNIKRFSLCLILIICASIVKSQTVRGILTRGSGKLFISYDKGKSRAIVNERVVTVKLKDGMVLDNSLKILRSNRLGYIDLSVPEGVDVTEFVETLEKRGSYEMVKYADLGETCMTPNDTYVSNQWYLSTINMPSTWNITTGSPDIRVAVLDLEIDWNHQDIGMGNDGYKNIDNTLGYNYKENTSLAVSPEEHGTLVAGIIGAKTNNMTGIAGISGGNGGQGVTIIPYGVGSSLGSPYIDMSVVDDAILDAVDKGAKVINMSLVSTSSYYPDIDAAILYAHNHGVTLVAASGNDYSSAIRYPASHSKVIAVGASDNTNHRASFSSYGTGLDLVAPGVDIYSTTLNNGYDSESGTSFSAPQVSGVAALMLSLNPTLTPDTIRTILRSTCTKLSGYTYTSGWNNETGYGLLNAYAAVKAVAPIISGSSVVCDSAIYYVENLPDSAEVVWTLSAENGSTLSNVSFQTNTPWDNACIISRTNSNPFDGRLKGKVVFCNDTIATLGKMVYAHDSLFIAALFQNGTNAVHTDFIFPSNTFVWLYESTETKVTSNHLKGSNIRINYGGVYTLPYTRVSETEIKFYTPASNNILNFQVTSDSGCDDFSCDIYVMRKNGVYSMSLTSCDNVYSVSLVPKVDESVPEQIVKEITNWVNSGWTLEVVNAQTGKLMTSRKTNSETASFNTTNWDPGLYVVHAKFGKEVFSTKINLSK